MLRLHHGQLVHHLPAPIYYVFFCGGKKIPATKKSYRISIGTGSQKPDIYAY